MKKPKTIKPHKCGNKNCPCMNMKDEAFDKLMKELVVQYGPQPSGLKCKEYRYKGSKKK